MEGGKNHGTTTLNHHMSRCPKINYVHAGQALIDLYGKLKTLAIDKKVYREMCVTVIIVHDLPHNFVEFEKIICLAKFALK